MTPDEATGPHILEWTRWNDILDEVNGDYLGLHRGSGTAESAASDLRYLMSAIHDRMAEIRALIDEVARDATFSGPGSVALVQWLRDLKKRQVAASSPGRIGAVLDARALEGAPAKVATGAAHPGEPRTRDVSVHARQVVKGIFDEWRIANRLASVAEQGVFLASLQAIQREGAPPGPEDLANARRLRELANDLLAIGMKAMDERARQLRRR